MCYVVCIHIRFWNLFGSSFILCLYAWPVTVITFKVKQTWCFFRFLLDWSNFHSHHLYINGGEIVWCAVCSRYSALYLVETVCTLLHILYHSISLLFIYKKVAIKMTTFSKYLLKTSSFISPYHLFILLYKMLVWYIILVISVLSSHVKFVCRQRKSVHNIH